MKSSTTKQPPIDCARLIAAVNAVREERQMSWYGVRRKTYITNLNEIVSGKRNLSRNAAETLATWAELDLGAYELVESETV